MRRKKPPRVVFHAEKPTMIDPNHPDSIIRGVVAKAPNGRWMSFDTLVQAKTILLPDRHEHIYVDAHDYAARAPAGDRAAISKQFDLFDDLACFDKLRQLAYNPYRAHGYEVFKDLDTNHSTNPLKRAPRKIIYKFLVPPSEKLKQQVAKLAPQAQVLCDIIEIISSGRTASEFTEIELKPLVMQHGHMLCTKQDPWRIFQYYRGKLISIGFMRLTR
jgi:hypothetical protein